MKRDEHKNYSQTEDTPLEKRRNFALFGGLISVIVLIYFGITAFPFSLFSEARNNDAANKVTLAKVSRPTLPASPLKSIAENDFANTNSIMLRQFAKMGKKYIAPSLQLFEDTISAYQCGHLLPATGAFYCKADKEVYVDLAFLRRMTKVDSSSAAQVQAYIIAHQVGHHIENLLGITAKIEKLRQTLPDADITRLEEKAELLADYYAGVWASYAFKSTFDNADILIADVTNLSTTLAKNTNLTVGDPYNYTNLGQRASAFTRGFQSGSLSKADVFDKGELR